MTVAVKSGSKDNESQYAVSESDLQDDAIRKLSNASQVTHWSDEWTKRYLLFVFEVLFTQICLYIHSKEP